MEVYPYRDHLPILALWPAGRQLTAADQLRWETAKWLASSPSPKLGRYCEQLPNVGHYLREHYGNLFFDPSLPSKSKMKALFTGPDSRGAFSLEEKDGRQLLSLTCSAPQPQPSRPTSPEGADPTPPHNDTVRAKGADSAQHTRKRLATPTPPPQPAAAAAAAAAAVTHAGGTATQSQASRAAVGSLHCAAGATGVRSAGLNPHGTEAEGQEDGEEEAEGKLRSLIDAAFPPGSADPAVRLWHAIASWLATSPQPQAAGPLSAQLSGLGAHLRLQHADLWLDPHHTWPKLKSFLLQPGARGAFQVSCPPDCRTDVVQLEVPALRSAAAAIAAAASDSETKLSVAGPSGTPGPRAAGAAAAVARAGTTAATGKTQPPGPAGAAAAAAPGREVAPAGAGTGAAVVHAAAAQPQSQRRSPDADRNVHRLVAAAFPASHADPAVRLRHAIASWLAGSPEPQAGPHSGLVTSLSNHLRQEHAGLWLDPQHAWPKLKPFLLHADSRGVFPVGCPPGYKAEVAHLDVTALTRVAAAAAAGVQDEAARGAGAGAAAAAAAAAAVPPGELRSAERRSGAALHTSARSATTNAPAAAAAAPPEAASATPASRAAVPATTAGPSAAKAPSEPAGTVPPLRAAAGSTSAAKTAAAGPAMPRHAAAIPSPVVPAAPPAQQAAGETAEQVEAAALVAWPGGDALSRLKRRAAVLLAAVEGVGPEGHPHAVLTAQMGGLLRKDVPDALAELQAPGQPKRALRHLLNEDTGPEGAGPDDAAAASRNGRNANGAGGSGQPASSSRRPLLRVVAGRYDGVVVLDLPQLMLRYARALACAPPPGAVGGGGGGGSRGGGAATTVTTAAPSAAPAPAPAPSAQAQIARGAGAARDPAAGTPAETAVAAAAADAAVTGARRGVATSGAASAAAGPDGAGAAPAERTAGGEQGSAAAAAARLARAAEAAAERVWPGADAASQLRRCVARELARVADGPTGPASMLWAQVTAFVYKFAQPVVAQLLAAEPANATNRSAVLRRVLDGASASGGSGSMAAAGSTSGGTTSPAPVQSGGSGFAEAPLLCVVKHPKDSVLQLDLRGLLAAGGQSEAASATAAAQGVPAPPAEAGARVAPLPAPSGQVTRGAPLADQAEKTGSQGAAARQAATASQPGPGASAGSAGSTHDPRAVTDPRVVACLRRLERGLLSRFPDDETDTAQPAAGGVSGGGRNGAAGASAAAAKRCVAWLLATAPPPHELPFAALGGEVPRQLGGARVGRNLRALCGEHPDVFAVLLQGKSHYVVKLVCPRLLRIAADHAAATRAASAGTAAGDANASAGTAAGDVNASAGPAAGVAKAAATTAVAMAAARSSGPAKDSVLVRPPASTSSPSAHTTPMPPPPPPPLPAPSPSHPEHQHQQRPAGAPAGPAAAPRPGHAATELQDVPGGQACGAWTGGPRVTSWVVEASALGPEASGASQQAWGQLHGDAGPMPQQQQQQQQQQLTVPMPAPIPTPTAPAVAVNDATGGVEGFGGVSGVSGGAPAADLDALLAQSDPAGTVESWNRAMLAAASVHVLYDPYSPDLPAAVQHCHAAGRVGLAVQQSCGSRPSVVSLYAPAAAAAPADHPGGGGAAEPTWPASVYVLDCTACEQMYGGVGTASGTAAAAALLCSLRGLLSDASVHKVVHGCEQVHCLEAAAGVASVVPLLDTRVLLRGVAHMMGLAEEPPLPLLPPPLPSPQLLPPAPPAALGRQGLQRPRHGPSAAAAAAGADPEDMAAAIAALHAHAGSLQEALAATGLWCDRPELLATLTGRHFAALREALWAAAGGAAAAAWAGCRRPLSDAAVAAAAGCATFLPELWAALVEEAVPWVAVHAPIGIMEQVRLRAGLDGNGVGASQ